MDDPNKRTDCAYLSKLSSASDVDSFLSRFNHDNNYDDGTTKLHVGDAFQIMDGYYNEVWAIAGFDLEHDRTASDGTVYDNGYGIMLVPTWPSVYCYWNTDNTVAGGYMNSLAHSKANEIAINMKNNILGTHLVNRNVLLSSSVDSSTGMANAATWTTAYGVLPSIANFRGASTCDFNNTLYDTGEANYVLPYYNYFILDISLKLWIRNINRKIDSDYNVFYIKDSSPSVYTCAANYTSCYCYPLIYIR